MKKIKLTKGMVALVDDADFERVSAHKWHVLGNGRYARRLVQVGGRPRQKGVLMHREILGVASGMEVDHIDGNGLNNQRNNLRAATHRQNIGNQKLSRKNKSGYRGVVLNKKAGKWQAQIGFRKDGKTTTIYLGLFEDPKKASDVYEMKARELFGEFYACRRSLIKADTNSLKEGEK